jgi:hypothetical protein
VVALPRGITAASIAVGADDAVGDQETVRVKKNRETCDERPIEDMLREAVNHLALVGSKLHRDAEYLGQLGDFVARTAQLLPNELDSRSAIEEHASSKSTTAVFKDEENSPQTIDSIGRGGAI